MAHEVFCVKLKKELPGLDEPPFDTELGKKIYENVSQEAWRQWTEFCKMILNENVNALLAPIRERRAELAARPEDVRDVLREGAERAGAIAHQTMREVRAAMGLQ